MNCQPLRGRTIVVLEARRSAEFARMIERAGGIPYVASIVREVPSGDDSEIRTWLMSLAAGEFDVVIFLTGGGCQTLLDQAEKNGCLTDVLGALRCARVVARGPKPARVLKQHAIPIAFLPPEPNTSDDLLTELSHWNLDGRVVGVQIYGGTTPFLDRFRGGLASLGAWSREVMPYRWEGPVDIRPVHDLIDRCLTGQIDALAILSSSQINNLFEIADGYGRGAELREALGDPRVMIAAVGPVTAQAVEAQKIHVDVQPEHPKMGHLVKALEDAFARR